MPKGSYKLDDEIKQAIIDAGTRKKAVGVIYSYDLSNKAIKRLYKKFGGDPSKLDDNGGHMAIKLAQLIQGPKSK